MNDAELQVLSDHLHQIEEPEDAEELARWLKYPGAVRLLLTGEGRPSFAYVDAQGGAICSCCGAHWEELTSADAEVFGSALHERDCWYVEALRVLQHPDLQFVWQLAHEYAEVEERQRQRIALRQFTLYTHAAVATGTNAPTVITAFAEAPVPGSDQEMYLRRQDMPKDES